MKKIFIKWVIKTEKVMLIFAFLLSVFSCFCTSFLFFDMKTIEKLYGYNQITGKDNFIIKAIGIDGITAQTYIFMFIILTIIFSTYILIWNHMSTKSKRNDLILFHIKGYQPSESNMLLCKIRSLIFLVVSLAGIFGSALLCLLFFLITGTDHMIVIPSFWYFIPFVIDNVVFHISNYLCLAKAFKSKHIIQFMRENY